MKTTIYINFIALLTFLVFTTSCEGDLEPVTYDVISPSNFFRNWEDVNSAVIAIYAEFSWDYLNRIYNNEIGTDEYMNNWGGADQENNFEWMDDGSYSSMYFNKVPAVTRAGALLETLKDLDFLVEIEQKRFIAEVKTARAIHMYDLLSSYGPCPVILDQENLKFPDNSYKPVRPDLDSPEGEQYYSDYVDQIETDLTEAIEDLETEVREFGRFDKGTALMVLLKLYMHQKDWGNASATALAIMELGKYQLHDDYATLWSIGEEENDEIIWALPRTTNTLGQTLRARTLHSSYDLTKESKWNGDKVRFAFYDLFDPSDIRRERIVVEFVNTSGDTIDARDPARDIYGGMNLKYEKDPDAIEASGVDVIYFRYADVLLSQAEALNEINGPNQESIDLLNQVRKRAGLNDLSLSDFASMEDLRDHILYERGCEFYMEGLRREDLVRHGKYLEYARQRGANAKDFHVLYPIPRRAYFENPNISQNPGYTF